MLDESSVRGKEMTESRHKVKRKGSRSYPLEKPLTEKQERMIEAIPGCEGDLVAAAKEAGYAKPAAAAAALTTPGNPLRGLVMRALDKQGIDGDWLAKRIGEAGDAERAVVVGSGETARMEKVPDHRTRLAAVDRATTLMGLSQRDEEPEKKGDVTLVQINVTSPKSFQEDVAAAKVVGE